MRKRIAIALALLLLASQMGMAGQRARNVILFIGDAGGLMVLNLASAVGKGQPQSLFIQHMPHIGLMETSTASEWVADSAAAMTAIATGYKTHNGVISQSADAVRGQKDGAPLKTILEYAEEHGLSTGLITDDDVSAATPAACYAHANDRKKASDIFLQLLKPRFGDGVDILIGEGKTVMNENPPPAWEPIEAGLRGKGYDVVTSLDQFQPNAKRAVVLLGPEDFDMSAAIRRTRDILSRNKKGYFLMVEVDTHTTQVKRGLERMVVLDKLVEETVKSAGTDTLVIFSADHSFGTRLSGGKKGEQILPAEPVAGQPPPTPPANPPIRIGEGHTGEEVVVAAQGPGAERVKGFFPNTQLFRIMMAAYGWKETPSNRDRVAALKTASKAPGRD